MSPDDPGYQEWVAGRRDYIGASDVAAVLGISPWDSPHDVWGVKLGHWPPKDTTLAMELGHWMEEFIARRWQPGRNVWKGRDVTECLDVRPSETVELDGYPHIRATPDRRIVLADPSIPVGLVECKNVGWRLSHHWAEGPPIYVQAQCQIQLACTGLRRVDVVALIDDEIRQYTVERDQATIDTIVQQVDAWWQRHIVAGERPDPTIGPPDKIAAALTAIHRPESVEPVDVAYEIEEAVHTLGRLKQLAKNIAEETGILENQIRDALCGRGTDAMRPGADKPIATWRPQQDTRIDTSRLRADYPEIAEELTTTTTRNVLRVYPQRCN